MNAVFRTHESSGRFELLMRCLPSLELFMHIQLLWDLSIQLQLPLTLKLPVMEILSQKKSPRLPSCLKRIFDFVCKGIGCVCLFKSFFAVGIHLICDGHTRYSAPTKELFLVKSLPKLQRTSTDFNFKLNIPCTYDKVERISNLFLSQIHSFWLQSSLKSQICRGNLLPLELFPLTSSSNPD